MPPFRLSSPLAVPIITQRFGTNSTGIPDFYTRWELPAHEGIDFRASEGTPVRACASGRVTRVERQEFVGDGAPYGIQIRIETQIGIETYETIYAHLSQVMPELVLTVGSWVSRGQTIGMTGSTGSALNPHLHLALKKRGATERGELQTLLDGTQVVYPKDLVDPTPYLTLFDAIDVSQAQGSIDWKRVIQNGVRYAYIRSTQGLTQVDDRFHENAAQAASAGLLCGFYHPLIASQDGAAQADHMLNTVAGKARSLPLAVDVELTNNQTPQVVADRLYAFLKRIEEKTGGRAVIYTSSGFWNGFVGNQHDAYFSEHLLWVANYTTSDTPALPRCWQQWWWWQYSSDGRLDGIKGRLDMNRRY